MLLGGDAMKNKPIDLYNNLTYENGFTVLFLGSDTRYSEAMPDALSPFSDLSTAESALTGHSAGEKGVTVWPRFLR